MKKKTMHKFAVSFLMIIVVLWPVLSLARNNILTGGIGVSLDYNERTYETLRDNPNTDVDESAVIPEEDDYRSIFITPMIQIISSSARDNFELRFEPDLRYDLIDYDTDWNSNVRVAADRFITRTWQLGASNRFLRSDYYRTSTDIATPEEGVPSPAETELSPDIGRTRYSRNDLNLFSEYTYREGSLVRLDFNYIVLRYDDDPFVTAEDYDRYELILGNEHRFNAIWSTTLDLRFIRGDFEPADPAVVGAIVGEIVPDEEIPLTTEDLSDDLKEYRLLFTVNNESIPQNPLYVQYYYIGTKYDEFLRDDSDIHQMRFNWRRDFSPRMYTILGIGPSYAKTENQDAIWDGNALAEFSYLIERGSFHFVIEKRYDVTNFEGTSQRGLVDYWDARFDLTYDLARNLALTGLLTYRYEDLEDPILAVDAVLASEDPLATIESTDLNQLEEYHRDTYIAGAGLTYTFWQFYSASIDYTFTKRESDRLFVREDYDDHRVLLTLSWEKDLFRW